MYINLTAFDVGWNSRSRFSVSLLYPRLLLRWFNLVTYLNIPHALPALTSILRYRPRYPVFLLRFQISILNLILPPSPPPPTVSLCHIWQHSPRCSAKTKEPSFLHCFFSLTTPSLVLQQLLLLFFQNNSHIHSNLIFPLLSYYPSQHFLQDYRNSLLTSLLPFLYLPSQSIPRGSQSSILKNLNRIRSFLRSESSSDFRGISISTSLPEHYIPL